MTGLRPLVDKLHTLELTQEPELARWSTFRRHEQTLGEYLDRLGSAAAGENTFDALYRGLSFQQQQALVAYKQSIEQLLALIMVERQKLHLAADECELKQKELRANTAELTFEVINGYAAYRPPRTVAVTSRPDRFRIDMFNAALGTDEPQHQPPPPTDLAPGYGDSVAEEARGVHRQFPLYRPDLVVDPTSTIPVNNT